jgi:hypothetical protein
MDNPEHCQLWAHDIEGAIKNGQSRALLTLDTRDWMSNQEWTIQSTVNFGHTRLQEQSRMDNPLDCSFNLVCPKLAVLWIVHSWLLLQSRVPKVDSALDCPFLIAPSMSCAQSWQCSGLSILDCSFNLVWLKLRVLWIVHSWFTIKNGQSRALLTLDTRDWRSNQEWTIQSSVNLGHTRLKEQSRMDNPETLRNKR